MEVKDAKQETFDPHVDEIKQEIIQFEESKIDHDSVRYCEFLENIHIIKEECNGREIKETDLYMGVSDIKQEAFEQFKTKSELLSLTTHCDLQTLKDESTDRSSYFDQPYNSKQSESIFRPFKETATDIYKKKKRGYPYPVCPKSKCMVILWFR